MKRIFTPVNFRIKSILSFTFLMAFYASQSQVVLVDIEFDGRQLSELNQPGYSSWVISSGTSSTYTEADVTFEFKGGSFSSGWFKAGVQAPNYAQLTGDGLKSSDIELHISGLPAGKHSLLAFHNAWDNPATNTFAPIDIFVNDNQVYDNLEQSSRVLKNDDAVTSYVTFTIASGETAIIRYMADPNATTSDKAAYINGFKLNSADSKKQASAEYPANLDEHVNADSGEIRFAWKAAKDALSHNLYFGKDKTTVTNADPSSGAFVTNLTDTSYVFQFDDWDEYYWRVDEVFINETIQGETWYFKPRHLAFEGAEGFGRFALGGRGGKVVYVTNLNDDGPGSLREAVTNDIGPRTILFNVSGIIPLESRLVLGDSYVTVAGQTAPGKGICIKAAPFGMSGAVDCIIQNVRVRIGLGTTYDGMGMQGSDHSIIDHCSISWTIDESFSSRSGKNITLQRTMIAEALNAADHQNYASGSKHGYAASISGDKGSFHHNLLAHCYGRNWSLAGGLDGNGIYAGRLDISNNVVYNFGTRTTDGGAHEVNFIANYYKKGPGDQNNNYALNAQYDNFPGTQRYYFAGNVMPGKFDESNQSAGKRYSGTPNGYSPWVSEPFFPSEITMQTAYEAYKDVLSDVGCVQPVFDDHDLRIIDETFNGTHTYKGSRTGIKGMPDSQEDVGGWEEYPEMEWPAEWDTDLDGLPNWWENFKGFNPNSGIGDFTDSNADPDVDGYTNLEDYLQWLNNPHAITPLNTPIVIDLVQYTRGYQLDPTYAIISNKNGTATIQNGHEASFISSKLGLADFAFKVTDGEGSSKTITVSVLVGVDPYAPQDIEEVVKELVVDKTEVTVSENGTTETIAISLTAVPKGNVIVNITTANPDEVVVSPSELTFTIENALTPQLVTITGVDDNKVDDTSSTALIISVDTDQSFDYLAALSHTVVVTNDDNDVLLPNSNMLSQVTIYPNPSRGQITVSGMQSGVRVELRDLSGRMIHSVQIDNTQSIEISDLHAGLYVVTLVDTRMNTETNYKLIVR